jgi:CRP-like cAMP-binding protein/tetratricopeptide (TPR) repeat protein
MILPETDEFTAVYPDEIRTLLAMLRMGNLGGLAVAECDGLELRTRLFDYFRRRLDTENIYLFNYEVSKKDTNLVRSLAELTDHPRFKNLELTGKYQSTAIFVYGIEKFDHAHRENFVKLLNFLRDRLRSISHPVVIWGTSAFVTQLERNAPDFWSWKGHSFKFPSVSLPAASTESDGSPIQGVPPHGDLSPLERYLHYLLDDPDYQIWGELYLPLKASRADETIAPLPPRHTLNYKELRQLAPIFPNAESVPANEIIFERGEKGENAYIIVNGEVDILVPDALGNDMVVSTLGKGDFFGEIALIKKIPRTATVKTTAPTKLLRLTDRSLSLLNHKAPGVLDILTDIGQRRLEARAKDPNENLSPLRRFALSDTSLSQDKPVDVRELIVNDKWAVVLGEAGAGKTTVLRRIVLDTAETSVRKLKQTNGEKVVIPIFVKLNSFTPQTSLEELILKTFRSHEIPGFETLADIELLLSGQSPHAEIARSILFLMDGLNEMPSQAITRERLQQFINKYGEHRYVLSCRSQDYTAIGGFRTAVLQRLSSEDIESFLVNYLRADRGRKVAREIFSDPQLEELGQTPLALFMLAQIARRSDEELPKNRGVLFEVFTDNLLQRTDNDWQKVLEPVPTNIPLALRKVALASLGMEMQEEEVWTCSQERWQEILTTEIEKYLETATPNQQAELAGLTPQEVHDEIKHSGLVRHSESRAWVEFAHHTYQEFFAALSQRDGDYDLEPHLLTNEARRRWQGTIVLLYGIVRDKSRLYAEILGHENDYSRIWLAAHCLVNSGEEIAVALQRLERTLPMNQHFALLFSAGLACHQLGRYPEALSYLHMANEESPGSAEVYYEIGSLYRKVEQYERAIEYLEEAIHLRSDFVDAYNQLGITYHDQGKFVEALTVFRATTQLEPANAHHFYNLGTTQKILRDYEGARQSFRTALKLKPDYTETQAQLSLLDKAMSTGVVRVLENIPILSKMTLEQSIVLARRIKVVEYRPGQIIFHMGEIGDTFYVIEAGEVEVLAPDMGGQPSGVINRLVTGDFFGEIALLRAIPRTATIRATKSTRLLAISREDFVNVVQRYPSIAHSLAETSGLRLLRDRQIGRRVDLNRYYDPGYIAELTHQNEVTVVMGDIHGSTYLTNAIGPELMVAYLDEYLLRMSTIIVQAGGAMDKSLGDSVMGVFGNFPDRHEDNKITSVNSALMAALKMRQAYKTLRDEWRRESPEFANTGMGIGISTGKVKTGTVGPEATMVGPAVNLSSKLSKLAIRGRTESEIYVDMRTHQLLGEGVASEPLDMNYTRKKVGVDLVAHRIMQRK